MHVIVFSNSYQESFDLSHVSVSAHFVEARARPWRKHMFLDGIVIRTRNTSHLKIYTEVIHVLKSKMFVSCVIHVIESSVRRNNEVQ